MSIIVFFVGRYFSSGFQQKYVYLVLYANRLYYVPINIHPPTNNKTNLIFPYISGICKKNNNDIIQQIDFRNMSNKDKESSNL